MQIFHQNFEIYVFESPLNKSYLWYYFFSFSPDFIIPQRVILAIMGFLAIANAYTMRVCLSVAITQMVVKPNYTEVDDGSAVCKADPSEGHGSELGVKKNIFK